VDQSFESLIADAESAPIVGWNFDWLDGRATEERPSWEYSRLLSERYQQAEKVLDLQSGSGEMLATLSHLPPFLVATEGYSPNLTLAAQRLRSRGVHVVGTDDGHELLPFSDAVFDLVTSRHPVTTWWKEIERVLRPGGSYLSQQVGPNSLRELSEYIMGPWRAGSARDPRRAARQAADAGLVVTDLREERLRTVFYDVGAVVYFLRLVIWIVPNFSINRYRDRLWSLHQQIHRDGQYVAHASRFLIEASKPSSSSAIDRSQRGRRS
jgi:SAM-dependent methyltransferase